MQPTSSRSRAPRRPWHALATYYRKCIEYEQMQRLQVSLGSQGCALLRNLADQIISAGAPETIVTDYTDLQQVRQLLARQAENETRSLFYAFPLISADSKTLIPVCYTPVTLESGPTTGRRSIRICRAGELVVNRRFLTIDGDLSENEVVEFARNLGSDGSFDWHLRTMLGDGKILSHGLLFYADPDLVTRSLLRELDWLARQVVLSSPLSTFIGGKPPPVEPSPTPGLTVVRSNPAQNNVLRNRSSVLQVVTGPPGTGKTQAIINLIASTVADGGTVLFVSKNNTAVDNVYEAFLGQDLFPGILRLGSQAVRQRSTDHFRRVLNNLKSDAPIPKDLCAFEHEGMTLARKIALLEEERLEVERLQAIVAEMTLLLRRTDDSLQESGLYRFAIDLAQHINPEDAGQFSPHQLVELRRLEALISDWQDPPTSTWGRILDRLGILERVRLRQLERRIKHLNLPRPLIITGQGLRQRLEQLLRIAAVYPFLLATARQTTAASELANTRSTDSIRADLDQAYEAKIKLDRQQLKQRWGQLAHAAQPRLQELETLLSLFGRMSNGTADTDVRREWWQRYNEVISVFPIICSTNLSLASTAPKTPELFDLVIIDEASQSDIASFLPALFRARRACVVGDAMQLRHISQLGDEADKRLTAVAGTQPDEKLSYHHHSVFDRAMAVAGQTTYTLLNRHYRCVPEIISFCNEHFYDGQLKVERQEHSLRFHNGDMPLRGFLLDDVVDGRTEYQTRGTSRSACNHAEAERVISLVRHYATVGVTDIGVVTPFRAQRELLQELLQAAVRAEPDETLRRTLRNVEIGTIHTFQGGQHQIMLFSTVAAPSARQGTIGWFEQNRNLLNVAVSRAQDVLVVVCHRATLETAGGLLKAIVTYADGLARSSGILPPLPPGLQPQRLGLRSSEKEILQDWLNPPGSVAEVLNSGEQVLYKRLQSKVQGRRIMLAPKMRVLDCLEPSRMAGLTIQERDYAFRAHFDVVLVDLDSFRPIAAVELDGKRHETDPLTQARDRLKNSLCEKARLPLLRVRWGDWGALEALNGMLGPGKCQEQDE